MEIIRISIVAIDKNQNANLKEAILCFPLVRTYFASDDQLYLQEGPIKYTDSFKNWHRKFFNIMSLGNRRKVSAYGMAMEWPSFRKDNVRTYTTKYTV